MLAYPLERHQFTPSADEFLCRECKRPRALHRDDGFIPNTAKPKICMRRSVRFGRHPHFYPLGKLRHEILDEERRKVNPLWI